MSDDLKNAREVLTAYDELVDSLRAEIEAMRAQRDSWSKSALEFNRSWRSALDEIEAMRAKCEAIAREHADNLIVDYEVGDAIADAIAALKSDT